MKPLGWIGLAGLLGMVLGYGLGRQAPPEARYVVGHYERGSQHVLYRYESRTGRTWQTVGNYGWREIPEPEQE